MCMHKFCPVVCRLLLRWQTSFFIPEQALLVLDEKCSIREISSTEKQSSAEGKIFTLQVCHKICVIAVGEFANYCQTGTELC